MNSYDVVIFDCDGVILDSNQIKTNAFVKALEDEPAELVGKFIEYHQANGGVSRYVKFKYFYTDIKKSYDPKKVESALIKYASIVEKELVTCDYIPGFENFIDRLDQNDIPCYVNTGSDEKELIEVFKQRNILNKFESILGAPNTKEENIERIFDRIHDKRVLYFGDAKKDLYVAREYDYDFIFIYSRSDWKEWREYRNTDPFDYCQDFVEVVNKGLI